MMSWIGSWGKCIIILTFYLIYSSAFSQKSPYVIPVPDQYFQSPVKHTIRFGGNFCELRNNHFHAGIDIKSSKGIPGDSIFAVADGHLRRVKVQRASYGQTVYIDHAVGLTSVYAHLEEFAPRIKEYVRNEQYRLSSFEVDLYPDSLLFPIKKGQFIGLMGNRGHSFGAHLHFEIRHRDTEIPVNPLHYGFDPGDDRLPAFTHLYVSRIDGHGSPVQEERIPIQQVAPGSFGPTQTLVEVDAWKIGLSVGLYDRQSGSSNKNGIYELQLRQAQDTLYTYKADHCSFDETGEINAHMNYPIRQRSGVMAHRCYRLPNNTLSMYEVIKDNGWITLPEDSVVQATITAKDFHQNESELNLRLIRKSEVTPISHEPFHMLFEPSTSNVFHLGDFTLSCGEGEVFQATPVLLEYSLSADHQLESFSIGNPEIAIKAPFKMHVPQRYLEACEGTCYLEWFDPLRRIWTSMYGINQTKDAPLLPLRYLGRYRIIKDEKHPTIEVIRFPQKVNYGEVLKWRIKDNSDLLSKDGGLNWEVTMNDQWILAEYDPKAHLLNVPIESRIEKGTYDLKLIVKDFAGLQASWSRQITVE